MIPLLRLLGLAGLMSTLTATAAIAERTFTVHGTVTAPLADDLLTVAHDEVAGYMPAMTMPFRVEKPDQPQAAALRAGDEIAFKFTVGDTSRAYDFRVLAHTAPASPAPPARRLREGDPVPAFTLVDQDNRPFTTDHLRGHRTVLTFIFTRCPVPEFCPRLSSQFAALQRRLAATASTSDVRLVSVTLDPSFDTPAVLRAYGEHYAADPARWRLCTGTPEQVRALTRAFAVHVEQASGRLDHTLATALIGPDGAVRAFWRGNTWTPDDVLAALAR